MKLNIPVDSIESKYLTPDLRKKINGSEQVVNNYITNNQITNINGVIKAKCVSATNISLNDTTTIIDGYTCLENDIILVAGQTDKTENGVYRYDTTFIRYDFEAGELVAVLNGTDYGNSLWKNSNNELVIGTTLIDFQQKFDLQNNATINGILFNNNPIISNDLGFLSWDTNAETLTLNLKNDVKLQLGQELYYHVKNVQGSTINNGQMVYAFGTSGNSGNINVKLGTADNSINARYFLGIATANIDDNDFGFITHFGLVRGIQTDGANYGETWVDGDVLYVSSTVPGGLTKVRPISPNLHIIVAMVIHSHHNNGSLFIRMNNGLYLGDLHDVYTNGVNDGDVLTWNDTNNRFEMMPVDAMPAGTVNQTLRHDGTDWVANGKLRSIVTTGASANTQLILGSDEAQIALGKYLVELLSSYGTAKHSAITLKGNSSSQYIQSFCQDGSSSLNIRNTIAGLAVTCNSLSATTNAMVVVANSINRFMVNQSGTIFSNTLTANTYLGANASKEIVSIPSPNVIKSMSTDITDSVGTFRDGITSLGFSTEASVIYELTVKLAFGNVSSRNGSVRMYADGTNFIFRPFIMGNFSGAAPDVIYQNDSTATQPFNMDNGNPLVFQTTGTNSIYELKGIFLSSSAIPNLRLQFKTDDIGLSLVLKAYSYMKISR